MAATHGAALECTAEQRLTKQVDAEARRCTRAVPAQRSYVPLAALLLLSDPRRSAARSMCSAAAAADASAVATLTAIIGAGCMHVVDVSRRRLKMRMRAKAGCAESQPTQERWLLTRSSVSVRGDERAAEFSRTSASTGTFQRRSKLESCLLVLLLLRRLLASSLLQIAPGSLCGAASSAADSRLAALAIPFPSAATLCGRG